MKRQYDISDAVEVANSLNYDQIKKLHERDESSFTVEQSIVKQINNKFNLWQPKIMNADENFWLPRKNEKEQPFQSVDSKIESQEELARVEENASEKEPHLTPSDTVNTSTESLDSIDESASSNTDVEQIQQEEGIPPRPSDTLEESQNENNIQEEKKSSEKQEESDNSPKKDSIENDDRQSLDNIDDENLPVDSNQNISSDTNTDKIVQLKAELQEAQDSVNSLSQIVQKLCSIDGTALESLKQILEESALSISRSFFAEIVDADPEILSRFIQKEMKACQSRFENLVVSLSPKDMELVRPILERDNQDVVKIQFQALDTLARGEFILEDKYCKIDAQLQKRICRSSI
jgi:hypothetical protein